MRGLEICVGCIKFLWLRGVGLMLLWMEVEGEVEGEGEGEGDLGGGEGREICE